MRRLHACVSVRPAHTLMHPCAVCVLSSATGMSVVEVVLTRAC
jgi:hypothetical protein